jgi:hypothetical protein
MSDQELRVAEGRADSADLPDGIGDEPAAAARGSSTAVRGSGPSGPSRASRRPQCNIKDCPSRHAARIASLVKGKRRHPAA